MNDRLEIASRLMAAMTNWAMNSEPTPWEELWDELRADALREADALIAEEARTRPPAGDVNKEAGCPMANESAVQRCSVSFQHPPHDYCDGNPGAKWPSLSIGRNSTSPTDPAPAAELRAVAEELVRALAANDARTDDRIGPAAYEEALVRLGWNKIESVIRFERRLTTEALKRARAMGLGGGK